LLWAVFWFFNQIYSLFNKAIVTPAALIVILLLIGGGGAGYRLRKLVALPAVTNTIAGVLCCLFVFNAVGAINARISKKMSSGDLPYEMKTKFNANPALPHPNVYWIQTDGMVGFDVISKYLGDEQASLKDKLYSRGFVVNEGANLYAGGTFIGIPILTSPEFYDSYANAILTETKLLTNNEGNKSLDVNTVIFSKLQDDGVNILDYQYGSILRNQELANSFLKAGYTQAANGVLAFGGSAVIDKFYNTLVEKTETGEDIEIMYAPPSGDVYLTMFANMLTTTSCLSVARTEITNIITNIVQPPKRGVYLQKYKDVVDKYISPEADDDRARQVVRTLWDMLETTEEPRQLFLIEGIAHYYFYFDENGMRREGTYGLGVNEMYYQWKWASKVMLMCVDMILEQDPNAVIVLESDHGFHGYKYDDMLKWGYTEEDMRNMHYSVMSAVRIPPQYGKLKEPLDPLDITRYLVNNFVGQNYEYLYYGKED
jgi:hypothetical protein